MSRGYRNVLAALAGLVLIGAAQAPEPTAQTQTNDAASSVSGQPPPPQTTTPKQQASPSPDPGCERGKDNRQSDLCAQWKAADAAFDAAKGTWIQIWLGVAGIVLGALTMFAAVAAAIYAKRAAVATERTVGIAQDAAKDAVDAIAIAGRNADAAIRLADISERMRVSQFRPYVAFVEARIEQGSRGALFAAVAVVQNYGPQPGLIKALRFLVSWVGTDFADIVTRGEIGASWIASQGEPMAIPLNIKGRPENANKPGTLVLVFEIHYNDLEESNEGYSSPGSFSSSDLSDYDEIFPGEKLAFTAEQIVPADVMDAKPKRKRAKKSEH